MAYNKIVLVGNLTADPELNRTTSGKSVTNFTVAVERSFGKGVDFINCTAWEKTAEFVANYFGKGKGILVDGEMRSRQYEKDGSTRTAWYVEVSSARFVEKKSSQERVQDDASREFAPVEEDEDLPF